MFKSRLHMFEFGKIEPQKVFLASEHGMYTYSDLERYTGFFLDILKQKSDSVKWPIAFLSESSDLLIFSMAAAWSLGIPIIPLSPKLSQKELEEVVHELSPSLIFCDTANRNRLSGEDVIHMDENFFLNAFTFDTRNLELPDASKIKENQIFGYFLTSGTTGRSKIVPLKRRQMIFAAKASARNFQPEPNHFWLLCLPLNHIGGVSIILRSILYGSAVYRMDRFNEEMVTEFLSENPKFQAASLVPTMLTRLLKNPLFKTHRDFKAILLGGGPTTQHLLKRSVERGVPIVSSYGMTETCAQIVTNSMTAPSGMYTPLKSVGKPFPPNQLQIRDDEGKVLGKNQSGMIWLKGPQIFDGYYQQDKIGETFDEKGWFRTGDYGHLNGFHQLFIESRREDLIISGGENINPTEVEAAIQKLPHIREVVVLGLPDEEWGQKVTAVVTLLNGKTPDITEVRELLKTSLVDFKIPKKLIIVDDIPKTVMGKYKRSELVQMIIKEKH
ncbi:MAG: o-succinylbenzoate--CoA ligase [Balneola sp.]